MYNNGKQILFGFYNGKFISKGYFGNNLIFNSNVVTITINPTPNDAKVTFSDYGIGIISNDGKSITVKKDTVINYTVSADKYVSKTQSIVVDSTKSINVSLNKIMYTLTINPTPSDATVILTASGYNQSGNSITVEPGTTVSYNVSYPELQSVSGTYVVNSTEVKHITLKYPSGTVLFESSTPGTYTFTPSVAGTYNIICVGGGGGGAGEYLVGTAAASAGGGSGGYSNSNVNINSIGDVLVTVGGAGNSTTHQGGGTSTAASGGTSSFGNYLSATGGGGGYVEVRNTSPSMTGGSAGTGITSNGNVGETKKIIISNNEYNGKSNGGASVYGGYGRGASIEIYSGDKPSVYSASTSGYVKVTFIN